jgi:hypothetical protein
LSNALEEKEDVHSSKNIQAFLTKDSCWRLFNNSYSLTPQEKEYIVDSIDLLAANQLLTPAIFQGFVNAHSGKGHFSMEHLEDMLLDAEEDKDNYHEIIHGEILTIVGSENSIQEKSRKLNILLQTDHFNSIHLIKFLKKNNCEHQNISSLTPMMLKTLATKNYISRDAIDNPKKCLSTNCMLLFSVPPGCKRTFT